MFKLEYELQEFGNKIIFTVTHQEGSALKSFTASSGIEVRSVAYPDINKYEIFVRGARSTNDNVVVMIDKDATKYSAEDYRTALEEYTIHTNRFKVTLEKVKKWYQEGRLLKTRNGQSMKIVHIRNSHQEYPIIGIIDYEGEEILETFTNGLQPFADSHKTRETDIIGFWEEENV